MLKTFFTLLLFSSFLFSASLGKATGCDLSQDGDVSLHIEGYASSTKAHYIPAQKVGKNFKELFIGSSIKVKNALVVMTGIRSNKNEKGKPRTGTLSITLIQDGTKQNIEMKYHYLKGYFQASGIQKNSKKISLDLNIKALLCYSK